MFNANTIKKLGWSFNVDEHYSIQCNSSLENQNTLNTMMHNINVVIFLLPI